jgi:hypothetical protein
MEWCSPSAIVLHEPVSECTAYLVLLLLHGLFFLMMLGTFLASLRLLSKTPAPRTPLLLFCGLCVPLIAWGLWIAYSAHTVTQSFVRLVGGVVVAVCWAWAGLVTLLTRHWSSQGLCLMRQSLCYCALVCVCLLLPFDVARLLQDHLSPSAQHQLLLNGLVTGLVMGQALLAGRLARAGGQGLQGRGRCGSTASAQVRKRAKMAAAMGPEASACGYEPLLDVIDGDLVVEEEEEGGEGEGGSREVVRGPEGRASLWSRLTFMWILPLLRKGYEQKSLGMEDLLPLEGRDEAARSHAIFRGYWEEFQAVEEAEGRGRGGKRSRGVLLIRALLASNLGTFYACGAVLLLSTLFALAVPVVLNALLSYIETGDRSQGSWQGYALAGGLFALVLLQSVTEHQFWIIGVRCCMRAQVGPSLVFSLFLCKGRSHFL